MKRQAGFTLVEIAIVLVVIGLLLGGVLKGQELILNSQIRNSINEYNNVASARFAYQDRYRKIPGDDDLANARWPTTTLASSNGNGNRLIDGAWNAVAPAAGATEAGLFWHHLRNDGLVNGPRQSTGAATDPTFQLPLNAFDGLVGVQENPFNIIGSGICQSNIPAKAAIIIDTRIDDDPGDGTGGGTGSLQGVQETGGTEDPGTGTPANYNLGSNDRYTMCREL